MQSFRDAGLGLTVRMEMKCGDDFGAAAATEGETLNLRSVDRLPRKAKDEELRCRRTCASDISLNEIL